MPTVSDIEIVCIAVALMKKKRKRPWVHPLNMKRLSNGQFHCLYDELRQNPDKFLNYYRMSVASFDELLHYVTKDVERRNTTWRNAISPEERLTVTLRYLATGTNFSALRYDFRIGRSTIGDLVRETCVAIWKRLQSTEMPQPTMERWLQIAEEFQSRANFPNCIGSVDGKHIRIMSPQNNASSYLNYKKYSSIVLMAVVDANYCFTAVDIGAVGGEGDWNVFKQSAFGKRLYNQQLNIPDNNPLPNSNGSPQPFVLVGGEAFGLHLNLLRPFPRRGLDVQRRIFNYRLNRARRFAECTFGILSNKWRVFHTSILVEPDFAVDITKAACVLHNFVRRRDGYIFEDSLTCHMDGLSIRGTGSPSKGKDVRDIFAEYFVSPSGSVPWQHGNI